MKQNYVLKPVMRAKFMCYLLLFAIYSVRVCVSVERGLA